MPGVYISYPFCTQKCSFCNFASDVSPEPLKRRYLSVVLEEIRAHRWRWLPETMYFGGGTPSLMAPEDLARIIDCIPRTRLTEVTLECAPGTMTPSAAVHWKALGINRISLGVQSFVASELRQTGRRHTAEIVSNEITLLRNAGIDNVNVDLIAGLPAQTRASWEESLDWIEQLRPPHVSVYIFELDEDSRLGKEALLGGVRYGASLLPSDDLTAELYERAVERLSNAGVNRYEISNFALPGFESAHNLKYWKLAPYVGFGLDAHSFDDGRRSSNPDTLENYLAHRKTEQPAASDSAEEHFFVGLRLTAGIEPTGDEWIRFARPIEKWISAGMLEQQGSMLRLSGRGVLLSNEVLQDFINV